MMWENAPKREGMSVGYRPLSYEMNYRKLCPTGVNVKRMAP